MGALPKKQTPALTPAVAAGPMPQLAWLLVARLKVDERYQRSLTNAASQKLVRAIAANFRWAAFGAVLAAAEDGGGWKLIDGQHRCAAAQLRDLKMVPAVIIAAPDLAEQAQSFIRANAARRPVDAFAMHKARLAFGEPRALAIAALTADAGITIPRSHPSARFMKPGEVGSIAMFGRLLDDYPEQAAAACAAVARAYGREARGLRAPFFAAAAQLLARGIALERLIGALRQTSGAELYRQACFGVTTQTRTVAVAELLAERLQEAALSPREVVPSPPRLIGGLGGGDLDAGSTAARRDEQARRPGESREAWGQRQARRVAR